MTRRRSDGGVEECKGYSPPNDHTTSASSISVFDWWSLSHTDTNTPPLSLCLAVMDAYLNPQTNSGAGQPPQAGAAEVPSPSQQQQQQQQEEQQEQQQPAPSGTSDVAGAGAGKHAKNTTAPSRLGKKIQPPRPARKKKPRPVPLRGKKTTAPSRLGKNKKPPRPASKKENNRPVPPRISTPIFCQSRAPAEMKKVGQPSIFPPSRPVEILAVHVKPWIFL